MNKPLPFLLIAIIFINLGSAQNITSPYLQNPELTYGYVDSCATFWLNAHDPTYGGFYTDIGRSGNVLNTNNKAMLSQTRDVYGFVRAYMLTGNDLYLQMARVGLHFLYDHAWDQTHGGWYKQMDRVGSPVNPNNDKSAFDQHYALLGIAAYYEATGDTSEWNWLQAGYNHLENNLWDDRALYFGYYDYGAYNWSSVSGKSFNATVDAVTTHLLYLYLLTEDQVYKDRLLQMADNILNHLVASMSGQAIGFVERYDSGWNWNNSETMTIMGHVLKAAWCLGRIYQIEPDTTFTWGAKKLIEDVLANGYDHEFGGPYKDYNRLTGQMLMWGIPDTAKAWWQMEQAVTAGLMMYDITAELQYLQMADQTLNFFMTYFVDHTYGEVYADRTRYGANIPQWGQNKGGGGKAGYHSIELGYYTYLYGKLFVKNEPATLHYKFITLDEPRDIHLTPLAIADGRLKISAVLREGQPYSGYDPDDRVLHLPAGTGGHFEVTYQRTTTGLASTDIPLAPDGFELHQNYPNPFNSSTTISYRLFAGSDVELTIYNALGQQVITLIDNYQPAGAYEVQWDGRNSEGARLTSGIYLYRLISDDHVQSRKMVLIK
jgi:mannose/cellobiose epimerase-like protein (N-acyl-D-glucosamine 2-epimerase family)